MKKNKKTAIVNAHVVSPGVDLPSATVVLSGDTIASVSSGAARVPADASVVDARGRYLMPGFIDVHTHGAAGYDFCDDDEQAVFEIARAKLAEGVTSFLPTTLTVARETLLASARNARAYADAGSPYAKIPAIHLEGPYINPSCCGAQNPAFVRAPDIREVDAIAKIFPVGQVSYAAEMPGGARFAKACLARGIVPSCGHSAARMKDVRAAYAKGLRHLTHFCNQMSPLHHREIGVVGAAFLLDDLIAEVICDRIHLCDDMLRLVFLRRDLSKIQMITDSLRCSHCPDGYAFKMGGLDVRLERGEARLVEGGNLAGSTLWMGQGLRNVHALTGIPLEDLVRTTSWNQALEHGWGDRLGKIEKGFAADLVLLDAKTWRPSAVFVDGVRRI
jgi:N-acetylglucosamine-6-phosphate deacetylase